MLTLVEIVPVVLEKKIFKICQYISLFRYYLPLEKGGAIHFEQTVYQGCFVPSLVKLA